MFDIDHFKQFNDTFGHQVGDRVLQIVAQVIRRNVREGMDIPARYGGEEFAMIMPDTDLDGAAVLGDRLREMIAETGVPHAGKELKVTISLGCATYPLHASSQELLIMAADKALYASKEAGRNCLTKARPIQDPGQETPE